MLKSKKFLSVLFFAVIICILQQTGFAQIREEYRGNIINYNGPRTQTSTFTLRINGRTSDEQAKQFLSILQNNGQEALLKAIDDNDLGSFSVGNSIAPDINVVRVSSENGMKRIFVVFKRWTYLAEARYGTRSLDYPFGVVEIYIDEKTGAGEGTYIAAARVSWEDNNTVEIENFATYPIKLVNVKQAGMKQ